MVPGGMAIWSSIVVGYDRASLWRTVLYVRPLQPLTMGLTAMGFLCIFLRKYTVVGGGYCEGEMFLCEWIYNLHWVYIGINGFSKRFGRVFGNSLINGFIREMSIGRLWHTVQCLLPQYHFWWPRFGLSRVAWGLCFVKGLGLHGVTFRGCIMYWLLFRYSSIAGEFPGALFPEGVWLSGWSTVCYFCWSCEGTEGTPLDLNWVQRTSP